MPAIPTTHEIELIIEKKPGNGGGGKLPPVEHNGGGDDGKRRPNRKPSPARYYTGIAIGIVSILMFFMALASAFLVLRRGSAHWIPVHIPALMWLNTAILLASSATLEAARHRLTQGRVADYRKLWMVTTSLGILFLIGQVVAWRLLEAQGIYLASNPASSFFYIFTGAHALHLFGGVAALIYVAKRNFDQSQVSRTVASEVASYYWHFMDGLWLFLLTLLYLGK